MSSKFNGFTQEDIKKLSGTGTTSTSASSRTACPKPAVFASRGIRRMPDGKHGNPPKAAAATAAKQIATNGISNNVTLTGINIDESMSTSIEEALFLKPRNKQTDQDDTINSDVDSSIDQVVDNSKSLNDSSILAHPTTGAATERPEESPFKGICLKDFETHRKIIEEQNKQKKEMLYKAIEQHSEKTAAEARKIEEIKSELSKLDNDLAADVSILRKQIENACINYANIEKQYNRIEAQFLKAKLDLHNACEMKELLTEHLCTVITHNEDRKAKKLTELMEKVGLTPTGELDTSAESVEK